VKPEKADQWETQATKLRNSAEQWRTILGRQLQERTALRPPARETYHEGNKKKTAAKVMYDTDPGRLVKKQLSYYEKEHYKYSSCFCGELRILEGWGSRKNPSLLPRKV
jgi:hypothetical protein